MKAQQTVCCSRSAEAPGTWQMANAATIFSTKVWNGTKSELGKHVKDESQASQSRERSDNDPPSP